MKGQLQHDVVVGVSATTMWAVYGTIKLSQLTGQLFPNVIVDLEHGDGNAGSVFKLTITNENGEPLATFKEKYVVVDDEKRVKVMQHLEGEYIDAGFDYFGARLEIVEKGGDECIVRSIVEYEIDYERIENATLPSIKFLGVLNGLAHVIANYVTHKN